MHTLPEPDLGLTVLPALANAGHGDDHGPSHRYGSPVVAPYPVDLERLASDAHDAHEHAAALEQCEDMTNAGYGCSDMPDDASVASWESLEGGRERSVPRQQSRKNKRRKGMRQNKKDADDHEQPPACASPRSPCAREKDVARQRAAEAQPIHVDYDLAGPDVPYSPVCFTGKPSKQAKADKGRLGLADVVPSMKLFQWDGRFVQTIPRHRMRSPAARSTHPLVDTQGRFLGLLLGEMRDPDYSYIRANVTHHLDEARRHCNLLGTERHRRGVYSTVQDGISFGGGQPVSLREPGDCKHSDGLNQRPMNMAHATRRERRAVARLRRSLSVLRIANFGSCELITMHSR